MTNALRRPDGIATENSIKMSILIIRENCVKIKFHCKKFQQNKTFELGDFNSIGFWEQMLTVITHRQNMYLSDHRS